ncbi:uncharacterized protein CEXT_70791 [Caerostris extrusa]|uniref:Uncharacterized protein n=1 Tax=Caerostris extrusa TaxID=172846 RepID=A0AAV4YE53_CAEEX|nr:uncharacterized protein CEXT_70791 [Caerostris extrusa]
MTSSIVDEIADSVIHNPRGFDAPGLCFVCDSGQVEHFVTWCQNEQVFKPLTDIGPKLKHLAILRFDNVEFDSIFKYCPGLESLKVDCNGVAPDWKENSVNLERLRRLTFFSIDGADVESGKKLFSLCINLEELFPEESQISKRKFLRTIKKVNTMNRLKSHAFVIVL